jgi:hypothetical protein
MFVKARANKVAGAELFSQFESQVLVISQVLAIDEDLRD